MRGALMIPMALLLAAIGCTVGPSEERLQCLSGCARENDSCLLAAMNADQIQQCDLRDQRCSATCPH